MSDCLMLFRDFICISKVGLPDRLAYWKEKPVPWCPCEILYTSGTAGICCLLISLWQPPGAFPHHCGSLFSRLTFLNFSSHFSARLQQYLISLFSQMSPSNPSTFGARWNLLKYKPWSNEDTCMGIYTHSNLYEYTHIHAYVYIHIHMYTRNV